MNYLDTVIILPLRYPNPMTISRWIAKGPPCSARLGSNPFLYTGLILLWPPALLSGLLLLESPSEEEASMVLVKLLDRSP